jgi:ATP-dependent exoDNAse (exonuclease V) beta subunit
MTLHKAKGLQFDAVILPALDLPSGRGDQPVLRWKVREHDGTPTLVLAPLRPRIGVQADEDPVYRWLRRLDAAEEEAELSRLLYVGATRARLVSQLITESLVLAVVGAAGGIRSAGPGFASFASSTRQSCRTARP